MKKEDKKTVIIAVSIVFLIAIVFSLFPSLEQKAQNIKSKKEQVLQKSTEGKSFKGIFMSWDEKDQNLFVDFYFLNDLDIAVNRVQIYCRVLNAQNKVVQKLSTQISINLAPKLNKKITKIDMGRLIKHPEKTACVVSGYE